MNAATLKHEHISFFPVSAVPAVTASPRVHAPPKVPLKPSIEDQEIYGSVSQKICPDF